MSDAIHLIKMIMQEITDGDVAKSNEKNQQLPEAVSPNQNNTESTDADSMPWTDDSDDNCAVTDKNDSDPQQTLQPSEKDMPVDRDENPSATTGPMLKKG